MNPQRDLILAAGWMRGMSAATIADAVACSHIRELNDGERVFSRGDQGDGIYMVISGAVRFSRATRTGVVSIIALLETGAWFGELSTFDHHPRTHDAHAVGTTVLLHHAQVDFEALLRKHPSLYRGFVELLSLRMRALYDSLEEAAVAPFPVRLARRLLSLAQSVEPASDCRTVCLTHEELGQLLGRTRQSIAKQLSDWQRLGVIVLKYKRIVIQNERQLAAIAYGTK